MRNYKFYYIFYICLIVLFLITIQYSDFFNSFLFFITLLTFPIQLYLNKRINKELIYMWYLADKLNLSTSDISQLSGIGILDLEATKEKNNFIYLPKRKVILTTTKQLEKISKG